MKLLHMLHDLTNPTGSVYFLWTKSLDGTSLHVKWRLQENPPTWYPPFLEYSRVSASMASTIGQTTLLGNSLIRDKIGSSLKSSTKGNNSSRGKGVANSLLPWLSGWHGLWPQWCLELLEFICLHPSNYIASNFKDGQTKKGCLKNQGFMYIPGLISLISICKPLQIFRANFYHCILILYDQEWRIILLNFFHSYLFLKRTQYLHELDSYT